MKKTITKDLLKSELASGELPAAEILYMRYGGMLYSYILQFVPDRSEAGILLADIFTRLTLQLQEGFDSRLSVYCWLQVESRKIILERCTHLGGVPGTKDLYFSLLRDAPPEHQWVFRELVLYGRDKEALALQSGRDLAYVSRLLRECLGMIRKNLG